MLFVCAIYGGPEKLVKKLKKCLKMEIEEKKQQKRNMQKRKNNNK